MNGVEERDKFGDPLVKENLQIMKLKHSRNFEDITWIACLKANSQQKGTNSQTQRPIYLSTYCTLLHIRKGVVCDRRKQEKDMKHVIHTVLSHEG